MAADIKKEFGIDAEMIEGGGGAFEVITDGELVFSKLEAGRFPTNGEVLEKLK